MKTTLSWAWLQFTNEPKVSLRDLLIPASPRSIWLLLVTLIRLESINLGDYLAATETWGQGSWTSSAGWEEEKSCSGGWSEAARRTADSQKDTNVKQKQLTQQHLQKLRYSHELRCWTADQQQVCVSLAIWPIVMFQNNVPGWNVIKTHVHICFSRGN